MGQSIGRILQNLFWGNIDARIVMLGLDAAGKTTVLYKLKINEVVTTIPTIGFNVETLQYKNVTFTVWDVGGQDRIRPLWKHYYVNTQGLIFVVDSNDRDRIPEARDELHKLLMEPNLRGVQVLVLANKSDLPHAVPVSELTEKLHLQAVKQHRWYVQGCCAITGEGLYQGLDWLSSAITNACADK